MLGTLIKKRLTDNQVANIFINALFETVDNGFPEVAQLINDDAAFANPPNIDPKNNNEFALVLIVGNLAFLENTFEPEQAARIEKLIIEKLAAIYQTTTQEFNKLVIDYKSFMQRVNHPSKNLIYGMSKAIFFKYKLNDFQDEYFKRMQAPNPIFLKRMDEVVASFVWDWDVFFKKYKLN